MLVSTYLHAVTFYISKDNDKYNVVFINSGSGIEKNIIYLEIKQNKHMKISLDDLVIKIKFFEIEKYSHDSTGRTRMRFCKK